MQLEYIHQTGLVDVSEIAWVVEDELECASAATVCITDNPQRCLKHGCSLQWDKLLVVYKSASLQQVRTLLDAMGRQGWQCEYCEAGTDGCAASREQDYYLCIRIRQVQGS